MQSASSEAITYRNTNPTHLGAEGTSVFGVGARVPTRAYGSPVPASRLPDTLGSGSMWGLPPRHTGLVPHYGQARGVGDEPTTIIIISIALLVQLNVNALNECTEPFNVSNSNNRVC